MINSQNNINFSGRYQAFKQVAGGAKHMSPEVESCFWGDKLLFNVLSQKHAHDDIKFSMEQKDANTSFVVELSKEVYKKAFGGSKGQSLRAKLEANKLGKASNEDFEKVAKTMFADENVKGLVYKFDRLDFAGHIMSINEAEKSLDSFLAEMSPVSKFMMKVSFNYNNRQRKGFLKKVESFVRKTLPDEKPKINKLFSPSRVEEDYETILWAKNR